jgi:hypothetical protein
MLWNGNDCGKKTKVMRILRQPFPVKIMIDQKQLENVEYFKYECMGSMLTNVGRGSVKLNLRMLWQKLHLTRRELFLPAHWT